MSASSNSSRKAVVVSDSDIFAVVEAAMRLAARKVAAENKRLGLPLIVSPRRKPVAPVSPLRRHVPVSLGGSPK